jgi:3-hydroxy-3-methylglutaryl CoA synthase
MYMGDTRAETIENISDALPDIYDEDIITIAESASRKLATLEESEYAEISFVPADETDG